MYSGINFDKEEKMFLRYVLGAAAVVGLILVIVTMLGCSSMSISRQAKVGNAISMQLDELHVAIVEACNSGRLSATTCDTVVRTYNSVLQVHREYLYSLQSLSQGKTTQEQITFILNRVQTQLMSLTKMLTDYGVLKGENR